MLISQQLSSNATKNQTRAAARYLGKDVTYRELLTVIGRLSYLYQHEIGADQRVALFSRNSVSWIATFFALTNIRALIIPMDPDLPPDELGKWFKETAPTQVFVSNDLVQKARDILQAEHLNIPIVEMEKKQGGEYDPSFTAPPDNQPLEADPILLLRTAGIATKPKYVLFTHKQLSHAATALRTHYRPLPTDRILTTLPWSHPFAFVHGMLFPVVMGMTVVIDHGLQAVEFLDFMSESRVTRLVGLPAFYLKLLITCRNEKRLLPGMKSITVGLGALEVSVKKTFDLLKIAVCHCYGMTENLWTLAMEPMPGPDESQGEAAASDKPYEKGSVGKGLPGLKYKVMDDNGDEVEAKGPRMGQLALSGPTIMSNYPNKEKETKNAIRGTWLYTGDLVRLDGEGEDMRMTFIGRKEDTLRPNGEPLNLTQIDAVMKTHPSVQDAAGFGVRDGRNDWVIAIAVVKKAQMAINEKQVGDHLAGKLPPDLTVKAIAFTDLIPRDQGGNVNYTKLRAQFSGIAG